MVDIFLFLVALFSLIVSLSLSYMIYRVCRINRESVNEKLAQHVIAGLLINAMYIVTTIVIMFIV